MHFFFIEACILEIQEVVQSSYDVIVAFKMAPTCKKEPPPQSIAYMSYLTSFGEPL